MRGGRDARVRKRFGQHFLEPSWVSKVVAAIAPNPCDIFIEIGPGRGAITRPLAAAARHVLAFEIDRDLARDLRGTAIPNLTVVEADFLRVTAERLRAELLPIGAGPGPVRVAGNLPYNVASPILFKLVELYASDLPVLDGSVMVQREVADRLAARPGSGQYGVLSVSVQQWADVRRLLALPPGAFRPAPQVHSAVVRLMFHRPLPAPRDQSIFEAVTAAIFTRRRKTLANALRAYGDASLTPNQALARTGLHAQRRPETLTIAELVQLADAYSGA